MCLRASVVLLYIKCHYALYFDFWSLNVIMLLYFQNCKIQIIGNRSQCALWIKSIRTNTFFFFS